MGEAQLRALVAAPTATISVGDSARPARPAGAWWGWHGLHGGAGVNTLDRAVPGGHVFGIDDDHDTWPALPVVAVVRSHAAGLQAARNFAAMIADAPGWFVLGLVVVADTPGRLPRDLERLVQLVSGGYPTLWRCPWVEEWRRGEPITPRNVPHPYQQLLRDLSVRTGMGAALQQRIANTQ
jgi:hypothetical protein